MRLKELAELQEKYSHLERTKMTKKSLCDLIIPFRDKYALTDGQALRVARRELTLNQIEKLMQVCSINAASVVEVKHGRWLTVKEYAKLIGADMGSYEGWVYCSECGQPMRYLNGWSYCPCCGTKMKRGTGNVD